MIHSASGISRRQFIGAAGTAVAGSMLSAPLVTGGLFRAHAQQGEAAGAGVPELRYGQEMALRYLEREVAKIETAWLSGVGSIEEWERRRREYRRQYAEMLGLWPMPPRTALQPTITGRLEHSLFTVEKLHFQSLPGVYVTANLYLPKQARGRVPVVLYLCGHARSIEEEVSFGNKAAYQHHPSWYARHGIASLIIDTLHGGEILAFHHGTHHLDRWWWNNRGYTPAGVEAWNAIRALDYLETRPEIDAGGMAVTGRSGGGAYSWSVLALDDRIITSVPTAGITDLRNYVGDQRVDTHCDCMFMVNTYRWDFPLLAALAAPRPVLLANTDSDRLFPVDGIRRLEEQVRRIYRLYGQEAHWRIYIGPGRHEDTPDLQLEAFTWIHRHLIGSELENPQPVASFFEPRDLRVFGMLPVDERNTRIDEEFIPLPAEPAVPASAAEWESLRQGWLEQLSAHSFSGWPEASMPLRAEPTHQESLQRLSLCAYRFNADEVYSLRLWVLQPVELKEPVRAELWVTDDADWKSWLGILLAAGGEAAPSLVGPGAEAVAWPTPSPEGLDELRRRLVEESRALIVFAPRGIGPTRWVVHGAPRDPIRRSFMLVGQTRDAMRVWDIRRAIGALRMLPDLSNMPLTVSGKRQMAGLVLYASLFESGLERLELDQFPSTQREGPELLKVRRILDLPQALAMAAQRTPVLLRESDPRAASWAMQLAGRIPSIHLNVEQ